MEKEVSCCSNLTTVGTRDSRAYELMLLGIIIYTHGMCTHANAPKSSDHTVKNTSMGYNNSTE